MTDAGLLARATVWAATDERCANQAFNIANGDLFRWSEMWPKIAAIFELEVGAAAADVARRDHGRQGAAVERDESQKHGLADTAYRDVSSWAFGDSVFSWDYDIFADGSKARRFGFHEYVETEAMFLASSPTSAERRIIP